MINDFIESNYPQIYDIFYDYTQGEEYSNSTLVKQIDAMDYAMRKTFEQVMGKDECFKAWIPYEYNGFYREFMGFFNGFRYAAKIMQEVYSN